jgi:hypothetical protein
MPPAPASNVGFVGVAHGVALQAMDLFWSLGRLHGGPAPARRFLPELIDLIWTREIDPGKVFDLEVPLQDAAAAYTAMDERKAIKFLRPPTRSSPASLWTAASPHSTSSARLVARHRHARDASTRATPAFSKASRLA